MPWRSSRAGLLAGAAQAQATTAAATGFSSDASRSTFFGKDRDSIRVGRSEGRFKAIRLSARGNDVEMLDLKVIYANGEPDDIPVRSSGFARARRPARSICAAASAPFGASTWSIARKLNFRGQATVCAEGLD